MADEVFAKVAKDVRTKAAPKYRDPASGKTWSGRGRTPRWLDGKNSSDFLIK
jgi:DNA-binding protein H-NS